jgi:hypothetical protein
MFRAVSARLRRNWQHANPLQEYYMKNMDLLMDYYEKQDNQARRHNLRDATPPIRSSSSSPSRLPRARDRLASRCLTSTSSV